ncbi:MAG: ATP-binding protein, partial [Polaromonas sp.]
AVARGKDLTEQILLAGRRGARTREVTDLRTLVSESVALARALLPAGIQLHVHVPLLPVAVTVHRGQLVRAILNLLRNASQAAVSRVDLALTVAGTSQSPALADAAYPADPDTVVGEVLDHSCVWLDVVDDGAGVAAEHIHQLFDPFFSSRSSPGSKGHGTGLGLAIVAGVVSDHSGGVAVWSSPGTQTRFRLMLPLALAEEVAAAALVDLQPLGNGEAVLVVAADALVRETLENAVAELGFEPAGHDPHETSGASLEALRMADGAAQFVVWAGPADSLLVQARLAAPHLPMVHYQDGAPQASPQAPAMVQNGTLVTITGEIDSATLRHAVKMVAGPAGFSSLPGIAPQFA